MRIAICFCGQIRTGIESSENIKRYIGDLYQYSDFFIHTWSTNTQKPYNGSKIRDKAELLTKSKINKIIEIYQPKNIILENLNDKTFENIMPQWYSFMKSVELKKEYEIKNDFEYDFVIKMRFDIIFNSGRTLLNDLSYNFENKMYVEEDVQLYNEKTKFVNDILYIGYSKVIDHISTYYNYIKEYRLNGDFSYLYGYEIVKFLNLINVEIFSITHSNSTIYRKECLQYSPLYDFRECEKCNAFYFDKKENLRFQETNFIDELKTKFIFEDNKNYFLDDFNKKRLI